MEQSNQTESNSLNSIKTALLIIPKYDGNPNQLNRFIESCECILTQYYNPVDATCFNNIILLHSILNRLEGKAEEIVNINGVSSWLEMKQVLLKNFGDQRDENCLTRDLVNMKQEQESPQDFYNRCMHTLNTIINYVSLHETDKQIITCKRSFFQSQTLKTFLAGLKEPLGTTIRAMRPEDMPTALNYIKEEENIKYAQKNNSNNSFKNNNSKFLPFANINKPLQSAKPFNTQSFRPFTQFNRSNNQTNFVKRNFNSSNFNNNSFTRPQYPSPQQGSRNQNIGNIPPKPEPMSGISHQSAFKPNFRQFTNYHNTQHPSAAACNQFDVAETYPNIAHAGPSSEAFHTDNDGPCASYCPYENNCNEYYNSEYYYDENLQTNTVNNQDEQNFCQDLNVKPET